MPRNFTHKARCNGASSEAKGRVPHDTQGQRGIEDTGCKETCCQQAVRLHELWTPLTHIKACVTSLHATDLEWDEASRREFLDELDRATDRLTQLVRELRGEFRPQSSGPSNEQTPRSCPRPVAGGQGPP